MFGFDIEEEEEEGEAGVKWTDGVGGSRERDLLNVLDKATGDDSFSDDRSSATTATEPGTHFMGATTTLNLFGDAAGAVIEGGNEGSRGNLNIPTTTTPSGQPNKDAVAFADGGIGPPVSATSARMYRHQAITAKNSGYLLGHVALGEPASHQKYVEQKGRSAPRVPTPADLASHSSIAYACPPRDRDEGEGVATTMHLSVLPPGQTHLGREDRRSLLPTSSPSSHFHRVKRLKRLHLASMWHISRNTV